MYIYTLYNIETCLWSCARFAYITRSAVLKMHNFLFAIIHKYMNYVCVVYLLLYCSRREIHLGKWKIGNFVMRRTITTRYHHSDAVQT